METTIRRIHPPGHDLGPCLDCRHTSCAELRRRAAMICLCCEQPIGYGGEYVRQEFAGVDLDGTAHGRVTVMHRVCPGDSLRIKRLPTPSAFPIGGHA